MMSVRINLCIYQETFGFNKDVEVPQRASWVRLNDGAKLWIAF